MTRERMKRLLITAFILFHLYIMVFWGMPGSNFRIFMVRPVEKYVINSGLWHSWDMFSPDPLSINFNVEAVISYTDGREKRWVFPRMEQLGLFERYQKERYRKWRERARLDVYAAGWDDAARYIARLNDTPTNHPAHVALVRYWAPIPPPQTVPGKRKISSFQPMISKDIVFPFNYHYKFYDVKPGDL